MKPRTARVLAWLQTHDATCARVLIDHFGWRLAARIYELRQAGYPIAKRLCDCAACQRSSARVYAYELVKENAA